MRKLYSLEKKVTCPDDYYSQNFPIGDLFYRKILVQTDFAKIICAPKGPDGIRPWKPTASFD